VAKKCCTVYTCQKDSDPDDYLNICEQCSVCCHNSCLSTPELNTPRHNDVWLCSACQALSTLHSMGVPRTVGFRITKTKGKFNISIDGIALNEIFGYSKDHTLKISCKYAESCSIQNIMVAALNQVNCNPVHFVRDALMKDSKISFQFCKKVSCRENSDLPLYYYNTPANGECAISLIHQLQTRFSRPALKVESENAIKHRDTLQGHAITNATGRRIIKDSLLAWSNQLKPTSDNISLVATQRLLAKWLEYMSCSSEITSVPKDLWMNSVDLKNCIGKRFVFGMFEESPDSLGDEALWARLEVFPFLKF